MSWRMGKMRWIAEFGDRPGLRRYKKSDHPNTNIKLDYRTKSNLFSSILSSIPHLLHYKLNPRKFLVCRWISRPGTKQGRRQRVG